MQKRLNRSTIQDAIPLGETDYPVRRSIHMLSGVQMGATWRVSLNDNNLYCCLGLCCRPINFHKLDINLSKHYAIIQQGQGFCSYGLAGSGVGRGGTWVNVPPWG